MKQKALLLIDIQKIYFSKGPYLLDHPIEAATKAQTLLTYFRQHNLPIIHIKHAFKIQVFIHPLVEPQSNEIVINKTKPSSFLDTELLETLKELQITELVIAGMMSHMCIDTTVRACQNYGFKVTVIEDACTTKDLTFKGETIPAQVVHKTFMASLDSMFANVISLEDSPYKC